MFTKFGLFNAFQSKMWSQLIFCTETGRSRKIKYSNNRWSETRSKTPKKKKRLSCVRPFVGNSDYMTQK